MSKHGTSAAVQGWYMEFVGALRETLSAKEKPAGNAYPVAVDYGKSVEEMVKSGRYDRANRDIASEHFPTKRTRKTESEVELVHLKRRVSTDEALEELDRMGCRPAELRELLAFGEKYPDVQREFPVVALGSVWQDPGGYRNIPYLYRDGSNRDLLLYWVGDDWSELCRFAAVRK